MTLALKVERGQILDHRIEGDATALFMFDAQIDNRSLYFERALTHDDQDVKVRVRR